MNQPTLLSAIARWIVSADFPDLPDGEIAAARAALADFVAVAAAGSGTPVVSSSLDARYVSVLELLHSSTARRLMHSILMT